MPKNEITPAEEEAAMGATREWNAKRDHLHDIFSPFYNRGRQRDIALEKRGPQLYADFESEFAPHGGTTRTSRFRPGREFPDVPKKDGHDLDRE